MRIPNNKLLSDGSECQFWKNNTKGFFTVRGVQNFYYFSVERTERRFQGNIIKIIVTAVTVERSFPPI